jgi:hypothetical protein
LSRGQRTRQDQVGVRSEQDLVAMRSRVRVLVLAISRTVTDVDSYVVYRKIPSLSNIAFTMLEQRPDRVLMRFLQAGASHCGLAMAP